MELVSGVRICRESGDAIVVVPSVAIAMLTAFAIVVAGPGSARIVAPASVGRNAGAKDGSSLQLPAVDPTVASDVDADW